MFLERAHVRERLGQSVQSCITKKARKLKGDTRLYPLQAPPRRPNWAAMQYNVIVSRTDFQRPYIPYTILDRATTLLQIYLILLQIFYHIGGAFQYYIVLALTCECCVRKRGVTVTLVVTGDVTDSCPLILSPKGACGIYAYVVRVPHI